MDLHILKGLEVPFLDLRILKELAELASYQELYHLIMVCQDFSEVAMAFDRRLAT